MSGFLIDGVPFVKETVQSSFNESYLDSDYPGNVNEYTTKFWCNNACSRIRKT